MPLLRCLIIGADVAGLIMVVVVVVVVAAVVDVSVVVIAVIVVSIVMDILLFICQSPHFCIFLPKARKIQLYHQRCQC
jgi:hypothetical protein